MRKKSFQIAFGLILLLLLPKLVSAKNMTVCAVPQVYSALEKVKHIAPFYFKTYYASFEELSATISNSNEKNSCSIVIADEEKLPVLLIETGKTTYSSYRAFVKAPLILWSADKELFAKDISVIKKKKLKSLAMPKQNLSAVGFTAGQIAKRKTFPTDYLKSRIYRTEHEFQAYSLVSSGNVQAGFMTKPVIMRDGKATGSYWLVPDEYYDQILYYIVNLCADDNKVLQLYTYLSSDRNALACFFEAGFWDLSHINHEQK
ncbi:MAG: substrate-binding domain-containing protein [Succinivibrio sp.]